MKKLIILIPVIIVLFTFAVQGDENDSFAVYFSPKGGCCTAIVKELGKASDNIAICMYYFTSDELSTALTKAKQRGTNIRIVLDKSQLTSKYSQIKTLHKQGISIRIDSKHKIQHNKYAVIDNKIIITGSYNWTASAETRNAENLLIIKNNKELATNYLRDFETHWKHSAQYKEQQKEKGG